MLFDVWLLPIKAVFKRCSGLLNRVNTPRSHYLQSVFMPPICYFPGIISASFALFGEKKWNPQWQWNTKNFFFYVPLCLDSSKEKNKQLLLRPKITFNTIKAATLAERVKSSVRGRDIYHFWIKTSNLLALIEVWVDMSLMCVVNSDLSSKQSNTSSSKDHSLLVTFGGILLS